MPEGAIMSHGNLEQSNLSPVDIINQLAGLTAASAVAAWRARRDDVVQYVQASYDVLLGLEADNSLSPAERTVVGLRVATLTHSVDLAAHYRERLKELDCTEEFIDAVIHFPAGRIFNQREVAILHHTDLMTAEPGAARQSHIAALQSASLSTREIVTLAQLVAFLSFQLRLLAVVKHSGGIL